MKILANRHEIAKAINVDRLPVITIDLASIDDYGLESSCFNIDNGFFRGTNHPYYLRCKIEVYRDERICRVTQGCTCLSNYFGYSDLMEDIEYNNAPVIKPDSDFVLSIIDSRTKEWWCPFILHMGKRIDAFCSTPISIDDANELPLGGFIARAESNYMK